ncbi:MAG: hypothetical protein AMJ90_02510 [candidate division Zixibacteria bacterium SM23_73_2]|nr:MAG: hypothetical protein AMJ90_02510 [candidate division Zixibacteria bacterium SM23_73_2]
MGQDTVIFQCSDAEGPPLTGSETVIITINQGPNRAPVLAPIGTKKVTEGNTLTFIVSAIDPDGTTPILYTSQPLPRNAAFVDSGNGKGSFTFSPDYAQQGLKEITFYASDGELTDYEDVVVQVIDAGNQYPILSPIGSKSVTEGDTLIFPLSAVDPDSTIPSLSVPNLPANASLVDSGNGRGLFTFTPVYVQSEIYNLNFIASDGQLADSELVQITVIEAGNQMPILYPVSSQEIDENKNLTFPVAATDADSTIPSLKAYNLPDNATFTDNLDRTGTFEFNPDYFQAGIYTVIFKAVDAVDTLLYDSLSVQITVNNVNRMPQIQNISAQSVYEGDTLRVNVFASDPDLTIPILDYGPKWPNTSFVDSGNGVGTFTFTPDYSQAGFYYFGFMAYDADYPDTFTMKQAQVTVMNVPQPPELLPIPDTSVVEGDTLVLTIWSNDPDNTPPVLSAINLPVNSQFVDNGDFSGTLTFAPHYAQEDTFWVTFIATDATSLADSQEIQIAVLEAGNQRPEIIPIDSQYIAGVERLLSFTISATDPDSTIPSFTSAPLPANAALFDSGNGTALFTFAADSTQADSVYQIILIATDGILADSFSVQIEVIAYIPGDVNFSGEVNLGDVIYLANYFLKGGPEPYPMEAGDVDGDGFITLGDVIYLANYLLKGGPAPPMARYSSGEEPLMKVKSFYQKELR